MFCSALERHPASENNMNDLNSKQKKTILIAAAFLAVFTAALLFAEWYLFQKDIREDGLFKAESIRKTMQDYDSELQKLTDWLTERVIINIRLSAFLIRNQMADGDYTGAIDYYEGVFVRVRDGQLEISGTKAEYLRELHPEDILTEYSPKNFITTDGSEILITSARIEDGLYYVTLTTQDEVQPFFQTRADLDQILTLIGSAYGGELFTVSNDDPEGSFTAQTDGFSDLLNLADLGLQPKDLEKQYFPLKIKTDRYMCYVLPIENRGQTVVYCDTISDEIQTGIHRAFTKVLFAGSFLTAMLVLCFSVQRAAGSHTLSKSEAVKYSPERMKQKILIFSLFAGLALIFITIFTTFVQEYHHENREGISILDSLEMQLSESERRIRDDKELGLIWYEYLGAKISSKATMNPGIINRDSLSEIADIISADLIMAFDEKGNETACSEGYIGFSLDEPETGQDTSDFRTS